MVNPLLAPEAVKLTLPLFFAKLKPFAWMQGIIGRNIQICVLLALTMLRFLQFLIRTMLVFSAADLW